MATVCSLLIMQDLGFHSHLVNIKKRGALRVHMLRNLRMCLDNAELHLVYTSYIRSALEYASPCFIGMSNIQSDILTSIDKRAHKIINNNGEHTFPCECTA